MEALPAVEFRNNHDKTFSILLHPHPDNLLEETLVLKNIYHKKNNVTVSETDGTITLTGSAQQLLNITTAIRSCYLSEMQLLELESQLSQHISPAVFSRDATPTPPPSRSGSRKGKPSITALASSLGGMLSSTRKKKNRHSDPDKKEPQSADDLDNGITPRTRERASSMSSISPEKFK